MDRAMLDQLVSDIQLDKSKEFSLTPRQLVHAFGWERRGPNCVSVINNFLENKSLEVVPDYFDAWIDTPITLRHKKLATTRSIEKDPVKKVSTLECANKIPISVNKNSSLKEAITKMMQHDFSQLPVMSGERSIEGYISWETIGTAMVNGIMSQKISEYVDKNIRIIPFDTPLLKAIRTIHEHGFAVVIKPDKSLCGIITTTDLTSQFLSISEPFLLIEQIENHIRAFFNKKILHEDLIKLCSERSQKPIDEIDDLTFGACVSLLENPKIWEKVNLSVDRVIFTATLGEIREIRNSIMHFEPDGITEDQIRTLRKASDFLNNLRIIQEKSSTMLSRKETITTTS